MSEIEDRVTVGDPLPKIAAIQKGNGPFDIVVTWAKGTRMGRMEVIDAAPQILSFKIYKALRDDPTLFARMGISDDRTAVIWPGNADLEMSSDALEELADQVMTNSEFAQFIHANGWSLDAAASQLGISRRLVAYYSKERSVPRLVALACKGLRGRDETNSSQANEEVASMSSTGVVQFNNFKKFAGR